jgi:glycosyltransferase involved in cell wall biosynthesis
MNNHPYRLTVAKLSAELERPLWSVMIPTYNMSANYVRETLASVLAQDLGPNIMQIMVVDDHSLKDNPEAVVKEIGNGRVEFYRQDTNVGQIKNFQTCLEKAQGRLIHLLHGDDLVCDSFYKKLMIAFEKHPEIGAAFCRHIIMDEHGNTMSVSGLELPESGILPKDWVVDLIALQRIQTPAMVVRRDVYEELGGFDDRAGIAQDWEMWVRVASSYPIWYEADILAKWRTHPSSTSSNSMRNATMIRHTGRVISIIEEENISGKVTDALIKNKKQNYAFVALSHADTLINSDDVYGAINNIREAVMLYPSFRVIRSAGRIILLDGSRWLWRNLIGKLRGKLKNQTDAEA